MPSTLRLFAATLLLLGAACGAGSTTRSLERVELGMSEEAVRRVAGAPRHELRTTCYPDTPAYLVYAGDETRMRSYVLFLRGEVAQVVRDQQPLVSRPPAELTAVCEVPPIPAS